MLAGAPSGRRPLVLALAGIGDLVLAGPAIRRLEVHYGPENCVLAVVPRCLPLIPLLGLQSRVITLAVETARWPRMLLDPDARTAVRRGLEEFRGAGADLMVNLHEIGSLRGLVGVRTLRHRSGVQEAAGRGWRGTRLPYTHAIPEHSLRGLHNVIRYHRVADLLGTGGEHSGPTLLPPGDPLPAGLSSPMLCINPGGYLRSKRWPAERFIEVGRTLRERFGCIAVLGSKAEEPVSRQIQEGIGSGAVSLAGRLDLPGLADVLAGAALLITNNSGPMHMAAALRVPVVALFGSLPVDPLHPWLPEDRRRVLTALTDRALAPIRRMVLPAALRRISSAEVIEAARDLVS